MRSVVFATAALGALMLAAPALAQPASGPDWTGFYIGLNAGGSWGDGHVHTHVDPATNTYFSAGNIPAVNAAGTHGFNPSGFTGGGQLGYNWQSGALVLGLETDFEALDLSQTRTETHVYPLDAPDTFTMSTSGKTNWMWTLRPRIGWAPGGGWLIYGTGGLAVADINARQSFHDTFGAAMSSSHNDTRTGWTLGGGVEYLIAPNWSLRGEYLYADFGSTDSARVLTDGGDSATFHNNTALNANIFRAAVNFKF